MLVNNNVDKSTEMYLGLFYKFLFTKIVNSSRPLPISIENSIIDF